jgi:hypothetical protein
MLAILIGSQLDALQRVVGGSNDVANTMSVRALLASHAMLETV